VETGGYAFAWVGAPETGEGRQVVPLASWGEEDGYLANLTFTWDDEELGRSPTGVALRTGKISLSRDLEKDPDFAPWREETLARGLASCLALPLTTPEQCLGVLTVFAGQPEAFPPEEVDLLSKLAQTLAFGLQALRCRQEWQRCRAELDFKRHMLDLAGEALFIHDLTGRFLEFNRATYEDLGYSAEELRQLNRFQLEPPEFAKLQQDRLQELLDKGEISFESAHFRKDSSVIPLLVHARVVEKEGQKLILSAAQDTSRLQQVTEACRQAECRMAAWKRPAPSWPASSAMPMFRNSKKTSCC